MSVANKYHTDSFLGSRTPSPRHYSRTEALIDRDVTPSLLGLPKNVRTSILRRAGLVRKCPISISQERPRLVSQHHDCQYQSCCEERACHPFFGCQCVLGIDWKCKHAALPVALLEVNRQMLKECTEIMFGENCFVNCSDREAYACLSKMSSGAIENMTSLHISFHEDKERGSALFIKSVVLPALDQDEPLFSAVKKNWMDLCYLLSQHRLAGLCLSVNCRAANVSTAKILCEPLRWLPDLGKLRINFGRDIAKSGTGSVVDIEVTLESLSTRAKYANLREEYFPFERLPAEIRPMVIPHFIDRSSHPHPVYQSGPPYDLHGSDNDHRKDCPKAFPYQFKAGFHCERHYLLNRDGVAVIAGSSSSTGAVSSARRGRAHAHATGSQSSCSWLTKKSDWRP